MLHGGSEGVCADICLNTSRAIANLSCCWVGNIIKGTCLLTLFSCIMCVVKNCLLITPFFFWQNVLMFCSVAMIYWKCFLNTELNFCSVNLLIILNYQTVVRLMSVCSKHRKLTRRNTELLTWIVYVSWSTAWTEHSTIFFWSSTLQWLLCCYSIRT